MPRFIEILNIVIPSLVTIIGLIITYFANKYTIINEIYKTKNISSSEKLKEYFLPLLDIIQNKFIDISEDDQVRNLNSIFNNILAYGSEELVRIATDFKMMTYKNNGKIEVNETMAYVGLLVAQCKYEITGQYIPADILFKYNITDYDKVKPKISSIINNKVDRLKLSKKLKCKD